MVHKWKKGMRKRRAVELSELSLLRDDGCVFLCSRFLTPFSRTSWLHTGAALNAKSWERKNRILYPPQEKDEPRRPAVSDTFFCRDFSIGYKVIWFILFLKSYQRLWILFFRRSIIADVRLSTAKTRCGTWLSWSVTLNSFMFVCTFSLTFIRSCVWPVLLSKALSLSWNRVCALSG